MEYIVVIVGILLLAVAVAGSILPGLPGPPLALGGLLLILYNPKANAVMAESNYIWIIVFAVIVLIVTVLDYYLPIWGTKKFGGTQAGVRGSTIGLIVGLIAAFFTFASSIIIGPFIGAVAGELMAGESKDTALKSGIGSFIGFATGTIMKILVILAITGYFIYVLV
ncbi:MAG: DUF456 domain-containing protein [Bacteroidia bacterium]